MNYKKIFLKLFIVTLLLVLCGSFNNKAHAGSSEVTGWAWSSNIGWVSLNCSNLGTCGTSNYKVIISTTTPSTSIPYIGNFSGYAWSPNIGWIKFDGDSTHPDPTVYFDTGAVTGWIRACSGTISGDCEGASRTDGWDGWIKLSDDASFYPTKQFNGSGGISYDRNNAMFKGFAWGDVNVGWFRFSPTLAVPPSPIIPTICLPCNDNNSTPAVTVTLTANPTSVDSGSTSNLTWTVSNATSCVANGGWSGTKSVAGGSEPTSSLTSATTFSITCSNSGSTATAFASVGINSCTSSCGGSAEVKLFIGKNLTEYNINSPVNDEDYYYPVKKPGLFDLKWVSDPSLETYTCTPYTTKELDNTAYGGIIWNGRRISDGSTLNIQTLNVDPGRYSFELQCENPLDFADVASSNTVKLNVIPSTSVIEER